MDKFKPFPEIFYFPFPQIKLERNTEENVISKNE